MFGWIRSIPGLTKRVDGIGIWWAVFGPGGVLSVIMGWAASAFTPIEQLGWGAVVFAGVGAACVVMVAVSALLIGWRYFHPLPEEQLSSIQIEGANQSATPPDWREAFDGLLKHVAILAAELEGVRGQTKANESSLAKLKDIQRTAWLLTTFSNDEFFRRRVREALTWWENHEYYHLDKAAHQP